MTCEHCDAAKEYIKDRKDVIRGEISTLMDVGRKDEALCMEARLREIEAVETRIYGGLTFVLEGDK
ncbi:MAG: hypothetical protein MUO70_01970 [Euryarchaeota archaeon]|nr:hypothetical protein [Euryarchaeota archaeon]